MLTKCIRPAFVPLLLLFLLAWPLNLLAIESLNLEGKLGLASLLGAEVDLSLILQDESGQEFALSEFFSDDLPVVVVPVYYDCPRLCGLTLNGVVELISGMSLEVGKDYKLLAVSFDASESPSLAHRRGVEYRRKLGNLNPSAWRFAVGSDASVAALMNQLGFKYLKDRSGEFAHGAAIMVLTPSGKISQFFSGIEFPAWDVKLSLVEASAGKIGSMIDQVFLFCFHFDPFKGRYTWAAWNFARFGSLLCLIALFATVVYYVRKKA